MADETRFFFEGVVRKPEGEEIPEGYTLLYRTNTVETYFRTVEIKES